MIQAAALTANNTAANVNNCRSFDISSDCRGASCSNNAHQGTLCNMADSAGVQYYDGVKPGASDWMDIEYKFEANKDGDFECEIIIDALNGALDAIAPEFAVEDTVILESLSFSLG